MRYFKWAEGSSSAVLVYRENEDGSISYSSRINPAWRLADWDDILDLLGPDEYDLKIGTMEEIFDIESYGREA